jgi:hypothetical protein
LSQKKKKIPCHEEVWGRGGLAPPFLVSILHGAEQSAPRLSRISPAETTPATNLVASWMGPRVDLNITEHRKPSYIIVILFLTRWSIRPSAGLLVFFLVSVTVNCNDLVSGHGVWIDNLNYWTHKP